MGDALPAAIIPGPQVENGVISTRLACDHLDVTSRTKRRERRRKRRTKGGGLPGPADRHAAIFLGTIAEAAAVLEQVPKGTDVLSWLEQQLAAEINSITSELEGYTAFAVCEIARLNWLPWNFMGGSNFEQTEGGPARVELLTLLASTVTPSGETNVPIGEHPEHWRSTLDNILRLSSLLQVFRASSQTPADPIAKIQASTRLSEVLMRNSSYPQMVKETLIGLFDEPTVQNALTSALSFDLQTALNVLETCDDLQSQKMSIRLFSMADKIAATMSNAEDLTQEQIDQLHDDWDATWDPTDEDISIAPSDIASRLQVSEAVVSAVLREFTVSTGSDSAQAVVENFTTGDNPLRTNPVVSNSDGRVMVVHNGLVLPAIRENFEQALKNTPHWEQYQTHRGNYLEIEAAKCFNKLVPGVQPRCGFEYLVPDNEDEENQPGTDSYTKLAECDLLYMLDDVAVIIEAKAVALAPDSRAGNTRRLRSDLTRIVTKAAEQGDRLKERIEKDGGFRLRDGSWVHANHIREIHTVAVSLEDLSVVSTATADLVNAGLLSQSSIPWTVSLNDLRLIAELVEDSAVAQFLLYLRRRRHPEATVMYSAVDELDFFLYFFENGLYVEPDPEIMKDELTYISEVRTADRRRRKAQVPQFITSRTDPLDAWYEHEHGGSDDPAPKPALAGSPMLPLVEELQRRGDYGWYSIGATLLSGSTRTQEEFVATPRHLIRHAAADGNGHHVARPYGSNRTDAWLLVWAVEDGSSGFDSALKMLGDYVRAKKYQLQLIRGAVLIFDSHSGELCHVIYDGTPLVADAYLEELVQKLRPADDWQRVMPKVRTQKRNPNRRK